MSTSQIQHPASHKRTSSAAGNSTIELPDLKRPAPADPNLIISTPADKAQVNLQKIYVLEVDSRPMYDDAGADYFGVYSTLQDANNALKRFASGDYGSVKCCKHGVRANGTIWWSSGDTGEGDKVKISVKIWDVDPPGAVPEHDEWNGGRDAGQGQDSDADWYDILEN
ncbi:hypothetical protein LARI1_G007030 [Lachnellula arida]|uniref:Uncharacterized protein n=1 Tax=Lachnellula arida TaxID=1316785 RepID=A0A8T9B9M8_9HELO|nr:hypothetical protein LARI1_G007030 [Lachnellula arida]